MKHVDPNSFYFEGFDIVKAAGFVKARPMYESTNEAVSESEVAAKVSDVENNVVEKMEETMKTLPESSIEELKGQINQLTKIIEKVVDDVYEEEIDEKVIVATKDALKSAEADKELKELRNNPDTTQKDYIKHAIKHSDVKLDLDGSQEEQKKRLEGKFNKSEALPAFIKLMAESDISEEAFSEILDMIKGSI